MSIYCDSGFEGEDADWWWTGSLGDFKPLDTKRSRKCCSCGVKIKPGEEVMPFKRWRTPSDRCNYIEESIYGDEVPMATWFMCETCGGLAMALAELGFCFNLGDDLRKEIKEYRREEALWREKKVGARDTPTELPNAKSQATDAALSRQVACTDGLGNGGKE